MKKDQSPNGIGVIATGLETLGLYKRWPLYFASEIFKENASALEHDLIDSPSAICFFPVRINFKICFHKAHF